MYCGVYYAPSRGAASAPVVSRQDYYCRSSDRTSQQPFRLLGTPKDQKRYVVYEGGHFVPKTQTITESLNWLDKYLGPVRWTVGLAPR